MNFHVPVQRFWNKTGWAKLMTIDLITLGIIWDPRFFFCSNCFSRCKQWTSIRLFHHWRSLAPRIHRAPLRYPCKNLGLFPRWFWLLWLWSSFRWQQDSTNNHLRRKPRRTFSWYPPRCRKFLCWFPRWWLGRCKKPGQPSSVHDDIVRMKCDKITNQDLNQRQPWLLRLQCALYRRQGCIHPCHSRNLPPVSKNDQTPPRCQRGKIRSPHMSVIGQQIENKAPVIVGSVRWEPTIIGEAVARNELESNMTVVVNMIDLRFSLYERNGERYRKKCRCNCDCVPKKKWDTIWNNEKLYDLKEFYVQNRTILLPRRHFLRCGWIDQHIIIKN